MFKAVVTYFFIPIFIGLPLVWYKYTSYSRLSKIREKAIYLDKELKDIGDQIEYKPYYLNEYEPLKQKK